MPLITSFILKLLYSPAWTVLACPKNIYTTWLNIEWFANGLIFCDVSKCLVVKNTCHIVHTDKMILFHRELFSGVFWAFASLQRIYHILDTQRIYFYHVLFFDGRLKNDSIQNIPLWTNFLCLINLFFSPKHLPHAWHSKGLIPSWTVLWCLCKLPFCLKHLPHSWHWSDVIPVSRVW